MPVSWFFVFSTISVVGLSAFFAVSTMPVPYLCLYLSLLPLSAMSMSGSSAFFAMSVIGLSTSFAMSTVPVFRSSVFSSVSAIDLSTSFTTITRLFCVCFSVG